MHGFCLTGLIKGNRHRQGENLGGACVLFAAIPEDNGMADAFLRRRAVVEAHHNHVFCIEDTDDCLFACRRAS